MRPKVIRSLTLLFHHSLILSQLACLYFLTLYFFFLFKIISRNRADCWRRIVGVSQARYHTWATRADHQQGPRAQGRREALRQLWKISSLWRNKWCVDLIINANKGALYTVSVLVLKLRWRRNRWRTVGSILFIFQRKFIRRAKFRFDEFPLKDQGQN